MTALEKQEDIDKVPITEPVEIEIKDEAPVTIENTEAKEPEALKVEAPKVDEGEELLRKQLAEANRMNEIERRRSWESEQRRQQAEANARAGYETAGQAQYEAIVNAIQAAQAEQLTAKQEYVRAVQEADPQAQADAQERLATTAARLVALEDGRLSFEARIQQQQQRQQQRPRNINEYIDVLPNLMPQEREWLKSHPDALTDHRKNMALQHHFYEAVNTRSLKRGSEGYFRHLEEALGYREPPKRQRSPTVAAPVSRDAPSLESSPNRITLTPEQREAAKISGVTEVEYARNMLRLRKAKANGEYSEAR